MVATMSELSGWGDEVRLPASVLARQAREEQAERVEAARAEREQADRVEAAEDRARMAYRNAAEGRGEAVGAMQMATGQGLGRSLADIFADAEASAAREDARAAARARRAEVFGDPSDSEAAEDRSGWPSSVREADRQLRRYEELRGDLNRFAARVDYGRALARARAKQERGHGYASRAADPFAPEITRTVSGGIL